jgi:hypothetical protein
LVGAEDLPEEDPERHQRCVNAVVPTNLDPLDDLWEALRRKDLGKGETALALLKKLLSEDVDLPSVSSVKNGSHDTGS